MSDEKSTIPEGVYDQVSFRFILDSKLFEGIVLDLQSETFDVRYPVETLQNALQFLLASQQAILNMLIAANKVDENTPPETVAERLSEVVTSAGISVKVDGSEPS